MTNLSTQEQFPTLRAHELRAQPDERRWLVEGLWAEQGVGAIGGEPKCGKSFLALDMAVSVASGTPCLRHFRCPNPGPVLYFAAEEALDVVRQRLESITRASGSDLPSLDLHVITADVVRLDLERDRARLRTTVESIRPKLLVLDPFVRLHRIDEDSGLEIGPILAFLRELQRSAETSVLVVHQTRKGSTRASSGRTVQVSSEIQAWGDTNLHLRRSRPHLILSVEHRSAAPTGDLNLELHAEDDALALRLVDSGSKSTEPTQVLEGAILACLAQAAAPLSQRKLRSLCRVRSVALAHVLADLVARGTVRRTTEGYSLPAGDLPSPPRLRAASSLPRPLLTEHPRGPRSDSGVMTSGG